MARVPVWARRTGWALAGMAALGMYEARGRGLRRWVVSQWAAPHGLGGWVVAPAMALLNGRVYDLYGSAARLLQLHPEDELVEIACGSGMFLRDHAGHVSRIAGLDASDTQVRLATRRLRDRIATGTAEIVRGDARLLPWQDHSFTAALCLEGLEYFPDPLAALKELHRVLRPGGRLVVTYGIDNKDEACLRECQWWGWPHPPEEEARELLGQAGFSPVDITYHAQGYLARFIHAVKPTSYE